MALPGPVIFQKFQTVPEIIIFLLFGFSSKDKENLWELSLEIKNT